MKNTSTAKVTFSDTTKDLMYFSYLIFLWWNQERLKSDTMRSRLNLLLRSDLPELKEDLKELYIDYGFLATTARQTLLLLKSLRKNPTPSSSEDALTMVLDVFKNIKLKIHALRLSTREDQLLRSFYTFFKKEDEKALLKIIHASVFLENKQVTLLVKSLRAPKEEPERIHKKVAKILENMNDDIFGEGNDPSLKKLAEINEAEYKAYRTIKVTADATALQLIEELISEHDLKEPVPIKIINKLLKERNFTPIFDHGFNGRLSVDNRFIFHTKDGKEIVDNVGTNIDVKPNPKWDAKTDKTFCYTSRNLKGNLARHYTIANRIKQNKTKFVNVQRLGTVIEPLRARWIKDAKSPDKELQMKAILCKIVDHVYPRIGDTQHERKKKTLGLHNLKVRNAHDGKKGIYLRYVGKKKQVQNHLISDPNLASFIRKQMKGKEPKAYLFAFGEGKKGLITPDEVNDYLKSLGSPVTIHRFRTYHATRVARDLLLGKKFGKSTSDKIKEDFFLKTFKKIAKMLGDNNWQTPLTDYVDPKVSRAFFTQNNLRPLTIMNKVLGTLENTTNVQTIQPAQKFLASLSDLNFIAWMSEQR